MRKVVKKALTKYNRSRFIQAANQVRQTPPSSNSVISSDVIIVSQVYHSAVDMALLALKSFLSFYGPCQVELLDDGTLTSADYSVFEHHLPNVKISLISSVDLQGCPSGGTWERLMRILQLCKNNYVIQVDTDTLTLSELKEVKKYVTNNTAFTIGGPKWQQAVSPSEMADIAKSWKNTHIQARAESLLNDIKSIALQKYLRGCSAFTGFPKGSDLVNELVAFSQEMKSLLGEKSWYEWGTEQFSSNVMISLCDESVVLPWPEYQNFGFPKIEPAKDLNMYIEQSVLIHFIGPNRFDYRIYESLSKRFCHYIGDNGD
ncbi:hypothetical protein [Alteromonas gilva]|uniref:Glycosyltransferase n=1 Tax=Alteromonas gilva TaxID=2987522 RepID=A0ABT5KZZ3_9ALTE|nr:hypothetical protein [Alteromonas gilva]MDC8830339.1 hypothetical protein [Alteromonas gilva]